jgi:hypothetical protein
VEVGIRYFVSKLQLADNQTWVHANPAREQLNALL